MIDRDKQRESALKTAKEIIIPYVDMGHFKEPGEATPYLLDGCMLGVLHERARAEKLVEFVRMMSRKDIFVGFRIAYRDMAAQLIKDYEGSSK